MSNSKFEKRILEKKEEEQKRKLLNGRKTYLPFTLNALVVLSKRYLRHDKDGKVIETPEEMFRRVADLAYVDLDYGFSEKYCDDLEKDFYGILSSFKFVPAGRTLANAGTSNKLVANCIVLHIEDSMDDIFSTLKEAALLQQAGSGLGFPLHLLRPVGEKVKGYSGQKSSGPISFLYIYNESFGVIKQKGRNGANMAVMSVEHPDILEFIGSKRVEGSLRNFNISVGLTNRFMEQVKSNSSEYWKCRFGGKLYDPRIVKRDPYDKSVISIEPVKMTARELFMNYIVKSAWNNGEPGCVFLDTVNKKNPLPGLGKIECCNPCGL